MGRQNFGVERGIDFYDENGDAPVVSDLFGAALPGGDAGPQDAAGKGSTYKRTTGQFFCKVATNNETADWREFVDSNLANIAFRSELVRASTGEALSAGVRRIKAVIK